MKTIRILCTEEACADLLPFLEVLKTLGEINRGHKRITIDSTEGQQRFIFDKDADSHILAFETEDAPCAEPGLVPDAPDADEPPDAEVREGGVVFTHIAMHAVTLEEFVKQEFPEFRYKKIWIEDGQGHPIDPPEAHIVTEDDRHIALTLSDVLLRSGKTGTASAALAEQMIKSPSMGATVDTPQPCSLCGRTEKRPTPPSPCGDHVECPSCINAEDCIPVRDVRDFTWTATSADGVSMDGMAPLKAGKPHGEGFPNFSAADLDVILNHIKANAALLVQEVRDVTMGHSIVDMDRRLGRIQKACDYIQRNFTRKEDEK